MTILTTLYVTGAISAFLNIVIVKTESGSLPLTTLRYRLFWGVIIGLLWPLVLVVGLFAYLFMYFTVGR